MLKRLYIDNFRCFVNFEYKPERKQLLLGANGSGKSSLLEAIRILQGFVRDDDEGDIESALWFGKNRWLNLPNQTFEIEAELQGRKYTYHLEFGADRRDLHFPTIETLEVDDHLIQSRDPSSLRSMFRTNVFRPEARAFLLWVTESLHCLDIDPYAMEKPTPLKARPRLARDMSNIGEWYKQFIEADIDGVGVARLSSSLQDVLDEFVALESVDSGNGCAELKLTFNGPEGSISYRFQELSDGQRCLIALYMILHFLIEKGHTVFLDEPDNFISLREIQPWLLQAEAAVDDSRGQLILISHHPEILNQWAQEYGLRFFREENGHVRTEKFKTDPDGLLQPSELIARGWEDE